MRRQDFLKATGAGLVGLAAAPLGTGSLLRAFSTATEPDAVWVEQGEPVELLTAAMAAYGGMQRFIAPGDVVLVKPNIGFDRTPAQAATTNPDLVAEVIRLVLEAGAKEVKVIDRTANNARRSYARSEIEASAKAVGGKVQHVRDNRFKSIDLPQGKVLKSWPIYRDYLEADKVINLPIAKQHTMSQVTGGLKNLMGVMGGNLWKIHRRFSKKIIDITAAILPTVTIMDAYRILIANGPSGGNLADVRKPRTLIMSTCTVTADCLATGLFDLQPTDLGYLREALKRDINLFDQDNLNLKKISLS